MKSIDDRVTISNADASHWPNGWRVPNQGVPASQARSHRRPEPALVQPSPGARLFGICWVPFHGSKLFAPWHGIAGIQQSCLVGAKPLEGHQDQSLMLNGGWLKGCIGVTGFQAVGLRGRRSVHAFPWSVARMGRSEAASSQTQGRRADPSRALSGPLAGLGGGHQKAPHSSTKPKHAIRVGVDRRGGNATDGACAS